MTTEWFYCNECEAWVGSEPPMLPALWDNRHAAWMHKGGTGHIAQRVPLADVSMGARAMITTTR